MRPIIREKGNSIETEPDQVAAESFKKHGVRNGKTERSERQGHAAVRTNAGC